jgi:16S rRNA (guanine966-N2)-methyltransferase
VTPPRIIAGSLGGRRLVLPTDPRVRPTADRVREAWMSILGDRLSNATVLDLFAGSGALGFEALSRGASQATFVELLPAGVAAIRANARALGVADRVTVRRGDAMRFIRRIEPGGAGGAGEAGAAFDLALADPPYSVNFAERLLAAFRARPFARLLAVEHPASVPLAAANTRRYGDIALSFCTAP